MAELNLEKVVLKDGELYETVGGTPHNRLLDLPSLQLVAKTFVKPENGETAVFGFRLSFHTDPYWRDIFKKKMTDAKVDFRGDEMTVTCRPADLERVVGMMKKAIPETNDDYLQLRVTTTNQVRARDKVAAERDDQSKAAAQQHRTAAEEAFDRLII